MNRSRIALIVTLIAVSGVGIWFVTRKHSAATTASADQFSGTAVTYQGENGKTVLELLGKHATVQTKTDQVLGEYVSAINGIVSGTNGKFWIFYVNGMPVSQNPSQYVTSKNETIEWKLE